MRARYAELLDRAVSAMLAAIGIYNNPNCPYRTEAFCILAMNGWELLLKAKWLKDHGNEIRSLYVPDPNKPRQYKRSRSGNKTTSDALYLSRQLSQSGTLDPNALGNLDVMIDLRDSVIHFYRQSSILAERVYEVGAACLANFIQAAREWFGRDLTSLDLYLMPLSFVGPPEETMAVVLNREEQRFLEFLSELEGCRYSGCLTHLCLRSVSPA